MKRKYVPDLYLPEQPVLTWDGFVRRMIPMTVEVTVVTLGHETEEQPTRMYALHSWDGALLTSGEVDEIVNAIAPFYARVSDDEIAEANEYHDERERERHNTHTPPSRAPRTERAGYIYILKGGPYYKIGRAKIVDKRVASVQPLLPFKTELLFSVATPDMVALEQQLHRRFASKRSNGEWFTLDQEDIEYIRGLNAQGERG